MLAMIIFVLGPFKFQVTLNSFERFPSYTNFIFGTVPYCSSSYCCCSLAAAGPCCCSLAPSSTASFYTKSFNLFRPYPTFSIILLYNKEVASRILCSLFANASHIAATGADTTLYNFWNCISQKWTHPLLINFWENFWKIYGHQKKTIWYLHQATSTYYFHNFSVWFFWKMTSHEQKFFFYLCFLSLAFL